MQNKYLPEGYLYGTMENREYLSSLKGLENAKREGKILEGVVTMCDSATLDLHVDLYGIKGIIPKSESVYCDKIKDIAIITRVGKPVSFKVMDIIKKENEKPVAILSRREAQRECVANYLMDLTLGDIIPAKITHFEQFGAFVDVGCGVASLLSIDSISISRISNPSERFSLREEIKVIVKDIDYETGRLSVSTKELFGTWEENIAAFSVGQTVSGVIRSIEDYGIFVELTPNLAGLAELYDGAYVGQSCAVYIKSIIPEKMKIKLVIIDTYETSTKKITSDDYYIDTNTVTHIDYWKYSPEQSSKIVETVF
jgi:small subunit ribosomal protein S1